MRFRISIVIPTGSIRRSAEERSFWICQTVTLRRSTFTLARFKKVEESSRTGKSILLA